MMAWTDRHCRYFHRQFTRHTLLYTEMVVARALVFGDREKLLTFDPIEHPVALQIGGSDPTVLARATRFGFEAGYDEINLNIGCPSGRVQDGGFGACLMAEPDRVVRCIDAMLSASGEGRITVKCRIGIDSQVPSRALPDFIERVARTGVKTFAIHARKALLDGLSPRQNRTIPPLDYEIVRRMKMQFSGLAIVINGGLESLDQALAQLDAGLDGVMFGRAAYRNPAAILGSADRRIFNRSDTDVSPDVAVRAMLPYVERELSRGQSLHAITRHMTGAFAGRPGARNWRRLLSLAPKRSREGPEFLENALASIPSSV